MRRYFLLIPFLCAGAYAGTVTYTYDQLGRLVAVVDGNGTKTSYSLDAVGNRTNVATTLDTTAPAAPTALSATPASQTQINLSWTAASDTTGSTIAGYYVFRGGTQVGSTTSTTYSDTGLVGWTTYSYTVEAYDNATPPNVSPPSGSASARTLDQTPPSVPTGLTASAASQTQINLSWTAATDTGGSGLAGYKVYRSDQGSTPLVSTTSTTYSNTGLSGFTTYTYTVAAYDNAGNVSAPSTAASAKTPDQTPPTAPSGLTATAISDVQVNLSWGASTAPGGSGLGNYLIFRNGTQIGTAAPTATTYSDTTVAPSTTYTYSVEAQNNATPTPATTMSSTVSVTTPAAPVPPSVPGTPAPSGIVTTATWTEHWAASTGPVAYYILSSSVLGVVTTYNITAPATSFVVNYGTNGSRYRFSVQACTSANLCSASSATAAVQLCEGGTCP